jgi:hypothetical protein
MNKKTFLLLLASTYITFGYAQSKENSSQWHLKEYHQAENIPVTQYLYNKKSELFYLFTNDADNIYLHLKANSEDTQETILMQGFTVSIKTKAKGKVKIQYPLSMKERMKQKEKTQELNQEKEQDQGQKQGEGSDMRQQGPPEFSKIKMQLLNEITDIKLSGFSKDEKSELIPVYSENSISGEIHFAENGDMLYTLTIPFKDLEVDPSSIKTLKIAMKSGSTSSSDSDSEMSGGPGGGDMGGGMSGGSGGMGGGMSGGPGGMGGGMSGGPGGMGGGGSSMGGQQSQESSTSISIKIKKLKIAHQ